MQQLRGLTQYGVEINGTWREGLRRLKDAEAAHGGAGTVANGDLWRFAFADASEEGAQLGRVTFLRRPMLARCLRAGLSDQTLEVFGDDADALRERLDVFAAGGLAADGAVGEIADRAVGETEAGDDDVLAVKVRTGERLRLLLAAR